MSPDEAAIRHLIATWLQASENGDIDAVLALMAPDAVFLSAGQMPMKGCDAFAEAMRGALSGHCLTANSDIEEVFVSGDLAYSRTQLAVTMTPRGGGPAIRRSGQTLSIYRKDADGQWLLTRDANLLAAE